MQQDRHRFAGLFLHDGQLLLAALNVLDIGPAHAANVAAPLVGIEQKRKGKLQMLARALVERALDGERPSLARLGLVSPLALAHLIDQPAELVFLRQALAGEFPEHREDQRLVVTARVPVLFLDLVAGLLFDLWRSCWCCGFARIA